VDIYIEWQGPYALAELKEKANDNSKDYGLYQIYGNHPVYGANVLLYIGKADRQTFYTRIWQEGWWFNSDGGQIQVYIGRLFDEKQPKDDKWSELISSAERLLIFAHRPANNASNISSLASKKEELEKLKNIRVYNYDQHRSLLPEISGKRHGVYLDWYNENSIFKMN
jgi:hypothetical protein